MERDSKGVRQRKDSRWLGEVNRRQQLDLKSPRKSIYKEKKLSLLDQTITLMTLCSP
jgi:hypothetical protein